MATMTHRLQRGLTGLRKRIERAAVRSRLLERNDRILEDMGFSRHRLEDGVSAWPWQQKPVEIAEIDPKNYTHSSRNARYRRLNRAEGSA